MKTMATQLVVALIVTQVAVGQESLREIGRQHTGPIETLIFREFFPVEIAQMARDSDLIARVRVVDNGESYFTEGERSISSDYKIQLIEQFASPRSLINGDTVVVTKPGGTLTVDGREIAVSERDFPPFQLGEEYIVFLKSSDSSGKYVIPYGAQGAFRKMAGLVEQVSGIGTWHERGPIPVTEFVEELANSLAERQQ